jgi:hypothetical protein
MRVYGQGDSFTSSGGQHYGGYYRLTNMVRLDTWGRLHLQVITTSTNRGIVEVLLNRSIVHAVREASLGTTHHADRADRQRGAAGV